MMLQRYKRHSIIAVLTAVLSLFCIASDAQVLAPERPENKPLMLFEEQYAQGHYAAASQTARQYIVNATAHNIVEENGLNIDKARYILALSSLKTMTPGGKDSAISERAQTPNPVYKQRLGFALAQYYFRNNELAKAITLYESTGLANLSGEEIAEEKFEMAYCYFNNKQFDKAEPLLLSIKELKESKYYLAGNYYYGLLVYNKNKYREALQSFDLIKEAKEYKAVVPYYIAEIYYFTGNRDKALRLADTLIRGREKSFYDKELHLLEAQCLFEEQRYKEALPYFDFYYSHADKIRKQDLYEIAYCDYRTSQWPAAIEKFKLLSNASDSLGQTAMYLLGDCYLKTGDKSGARNAFGICADMNFNSGQQEASMILFSRLSYETGHDDDALRQLNALIATFPGTQYKDEANTLISDLLVKTNKYGEALTHLKAVGRKDATFKQIYQKATYGYAVQQFKEGNINKAMDNFSLSLEHPVNPDYEAAALFWKGDIAYRLKHYEEVITYEEQFISRQGDAKEITHISPPATVQHAYLDMGYASMALENFTAAQNYFNRAREDAGDNYSGMVAAVREADAVFMQKNYPKAITLYDRIIITDKENADYARYQKAILMGLQGKNNEKIALLQTIINGIPPGAYVNHARYELAITYLETDKYTQALSYLHQLTDSVNDKSFAPQSWMKTGFVYQQINNNAKAIDAYKEVVIGYPASEDRLPALEALKSLYIQSNQPAAYARLLKDNNLPSAESSAIDSTYYAAAETQFAAGKWQEAREAFGIYLSEYPNGIFAIKARYYRGESNYQLKKYKEAKDDYKYILGLRQCNEFMENSSLRAAGIAYEEKNYAEAFDFYMQLRNCTATAQTKELAYKGLMKSGFKAGRYADASIYADSAMGIPGISTEATNEALYFKGRSLQLSDSLDAAMTIYKQLSGNKNGEIAAESRYHVAEILLKQDKNKEAETAANDAIRLSAGYDYWIVKSYLALAEVLVKQKDYFNAKATLQSVVKHTKIDELKQEAIKNLDEVNKLEKKQSKVAEE
jgi:TolA-binding protein